MHSFAPPRQSRGGAYKAKSPSTALLCTPQCVGRDDIIIARGGGLGMRTPPHPLRGSSPSRGSQAPPPYPPSREGESNGGSRRGQYGGRLCTPHPSACGGHLPLEGKGGGSVRVGGFCTGLGRVLGWVLHGFGTGFGWLWDVVLHGFGAGFGRPWGRRFARLWGGFCALHRKNTYIFGKMNKPQRIFIYFGISLKFHSINL